MGKAAIFDAPQLRRLEYDEDTDVTIEFLTVEEAKVLNKAVEKIVQRTGSDWSTVWNQKLGERVVKGWCHRTMPDHPGFVKPDGSLIPFTPENRDMMMKRNREFSLFVGQSAVDAKLFLDIQAAVEERLEVKND